MARLLASGRPAWRAAALPRAPPGLAGHTGQPDGARQFSGRMDVANVGLLSMIPVIAASMITPHHPVGGMADANRSHYSYCRHAPQVGMRWGLAPAVAPEVGVDVDRPPTLASVVGLHTSTSSL